MKNTNDFSKCKVCDKLWSIQLGECQVIVKSGNLGCVPIRDGCIIDNNYRIYSFNGNYAELDYNQSLYFSNPEIIAPEKPKES